MTNHLFTATFLLAAPFWAMMIFLPGWRWTERIIGSPLIIVPPLLIYVILLIPILGDVLPAVSSPDLPVLQDLLSTPAGAAAIWAHVIAFDLFVGRWMYRDARRRGINAWLMGPLLLVTILLAPIGFLIYIALRSLTAPALTPEPPRRDLPRVQHPLAD